MTPLKDFRGVFLFYGPLRSLYNKYVFYSKRK